MDEQGGISPAWVAAVYGSLALLCGAVATRGVMGDQPGLMTTGLLGLVVVGCTLPLALKRGSPAGAPANGSSKAAEAELHEVRGQLRTLARAIQDLQESMVLSDDARRVLNRKRERELLRKAIQEDINAEDWDAAMVLIRELAERFGYRSDAEEFRQKVETARFTTMDRRVSEAVRGLEELIVRSEWDAALEEAARIARLFPDSPKTEGLRHRVIASRDRYKIDLERRFLHAAQAERVDEAMDLLRQMDQYLTESEGEQFREVARGVIGKARENLGAQFRLAVQDRQWERAAEIGDRIIDEFPNTRMASEVRAMIDTIRERAGAMRR
jgi:tetratricopeptide (TPR) repeat protein